MKKYFLKWIAVEGEINTGCKALHNGQVVTVLEQEGEEGTWKTDGSPKYGSNLRPVKLFLCSHDIQVDDKFVHETLATRTEHTCIARPAEQNVIADDNVDYFKGSCFKVIGEISPDAYTFAKEGMEFDEDQWQLWRKDLMGRESEIYKNTPPPAIGPNEPFVKLQCSNCKHYH